MLVKFLTSLSLGFICGVLIHSMFFVTPVSLFVITILIAVGLFLLFFKHKYLLLMSIFIIGISFGLLRFAASINTYSSSVLDVFIENTEAIKTKGVIESESINTPSYTQFIVSIESLVTKDDALLPADTRLLVTTNNYIDYEYGQEVFVTGKVQKPESFNTDTGRIFNYKSYLEKDNIYYIIRYADVEITSQGKKSIQRTLFRLKNTFLYHIYKYIPEPESGLLAGVLFGEKSALSDEMEEKFRVVGLMHIVVLSGYNVSLVIQIFTKLLRFLPRRLRSVLAVFAIAAFALLVGAGPTVIRASIMAVFIVLADVVGARYNISRALFIAGLVMIIWNPMILYFDVSFQLSFLATYGLIMFSPVVEKWFQKLPTFLAIRESAIATVSAQIIVAPLILYTIGEFSLISPLVNVLVLFAVPWSMLLGFITAVFGMTFSILAPVLGFVTTYLLKYQLWIVDVFAEIPFANISIPKFHPVIMIGMYIIIFRWMYVISNSSEDKI